MDSQNLITTKPDFLTNRLEMPYYLHRFDKLDSRYYYEVEDRRDTIGDIVIHPYISITSLANKVIPGGKQIDLWRASLGKDAEKYMVERAEFGTLFHKLALDSLLGKSKIHKKGFDFDWLRKRDKTGMTNFERMIPVEWRWAAGKWEWAFTRGLLAWFEFVRTTIDDVIAVEVTLRSKDGLFASTIDLVHTAKFYGKSQMCITDIKSFLYAPEDDKKKGFYSPHEFQLEGCKKVWNENFPGEKVTMLFNWSPTQWRKEPGWTWKNQTKNQYANKSKVGNKLMTGFEILLAFAKNQQYNVPPSNIIHVGGKIKNIKDFNWKDNIYELKITE